MLHGIPAFISGGMLLLVVIALMFNNGRAWGVLPVGL